MSRYERSDVGPSSARRGLAGWVGGGGLGLARGLYGGVRWPDSRLREVQAHAGRILDCDALKRPDNPGPEGPPALRPSVDHTNEARRTTWSSS